MVAVNDNAEWYFPIKDYLGSIRTVIKEGTSTVNSKYHYSPFGKMMYSTVNMDVPYKFTGQEYDVETGIYNFRARMYDPELGIFYGVDPAGQGFSPFGYAGNNPVIFVDKDGRWIWLAVAAVVGAAINVATHWDELESPGDWFAAIGVGAGAGLLAGLSGGAALGSFGVTAGAGGFLGGSI